MAAENASVTAEAQAAGPSRAGSTSLSWIKKSLTASLDQGLISGSNFFLSVALARALSAEQYGAYAVAMATFLLVTSVHNSFVLEPVGVFGVRYQGAERKGYYQTLLWFHLAICLLFAVLLAVAAAVVAVTAWGAVLSHALFGAAAATPCILLLWLWRRIAYLEFQPHLALKGAIAYVLVLALFYAGLMWRHALSPFTVLLAQAGGSLIASMFLLRAMPPSFARSIRWDAIQQNWRYGRWILAASVGYWLSNGAYYLIVGLVLSIGNVAALKAIQNIVLPINQFIVAMGMLLLPWASRQVSENGATGLLYARRRITAVFTIPALAYMAFLIVAGTPALRLLYGGRYMDVAPLLVLAGVPVLLTCVSEGCVIGLRVIEAPSVLFHAYTLSGLFAVICGFIMTRHWGLAGALWASCASSLIFLVAVTVGMRVRQRCFSQHGQPSPVANSVCP